MADRYAYIPLVGIFVMIAWGLADLADAREVGALWRVIPAVCVLIALSSVTYRQIGYWDSDYDLWARVLAVNERNPFAHDAMGSALMDPDFVKSLRIRRRHLDTVQQRIEAARQHFEQALELRRDSWRPRILRCTCRTWPRL